jgi:CelD/BcsL family acetyltransferase involved in cellulose biosynthesis
MGGEIRTFPDTGLSSDTPVASQPTMSSTFASVVSAPTSRDAIRTRDGESPPRLTPVRMPAVLRVERLPGAEAFPTVRRAWEELDARLSPRTPFTSPLWNELWWKHYRASRLFVRDELFVHLVRDARSRLVAVAPMMLTHRPSVGPVRARVLQCFGTDVNVTELRGLVCRPEDQLDVQLALSHHFARVPASWDWIDWGAFRDDGSTCETLADNGLIGFERATPSYHLTLPETWEQFRGGLSRNIKQSLRKCYNSLKRAGHAFTFRVVSHPSQLAEALATFFRLHAQRGEASTRIRHADVFRAATDRAFISEYAAEMAHQGKLHLFQLEIAGQVVATRMAFRLGDQLYLYYSGYDTRWAKYSVMTTVVAEAIKWAIGEGLNVVNLSTGQDVSKLRWGPQETIHRSALEISPGKRSQLAYRAYHDVLRLGRPDSHLGRWLTILRR